MNGVIRIINKTFVLAMLALFAALPTIASDEKIHVVLLNPAEPDYWFWQMTTDFMQAAADDLNIELEVKYSNRDHMLTVHQAHEVLSRDNPPDYILTGNEKGSAGGVIKAAQKAGGKVFMFNNAFVRKADIQHFGKPREVFSAWIGQFLPNNFAAGYLMGKALIEKGFEQGLNTKEGILNVVAIAGAFNTHASAKRIEGLRAAVHEYDERVSLLQVIPSDWTERTALLKSRRVYQRYHNISAIWGANDSSAIGAMKAAQEIGKIPGKDILFAGCGWSKTGIEKTKQGKLLTTVGGHFMDAAWSLVLIHDYHHGKDFGNRSMESNMYPIIASNADIYQQAFNRKNWGKIDFTRFSKVLNPTLKDYNFSLNAVLKQL